jgi:hypothetical protein
MLIGCVGWLSLIASFEVYVLGIKHHREFNSLDGGFP